MGSSAGRDGALREKGRASGPRRPAQCDSRTPRLLPQYAAGLAARSHLRWLLVLLCGAILVSSCRSTQEDKPWVASTRGEVYYWAECRAAERLSPQYRIYFASAEEARRAGYRPSTARGCEGPGAIAASVPAPGASTDGARPSEVPALPAGTRRCTITRVSDGDTVVCESGEKVRLLLIDTPETGQKPFGQRAREALLGLAPPGTTVSLETDIQPKDRYGRTLAYLWLPDGGMANERMARAGYAVPLVYPPNVKYLDRIRSAAAEAKAARRGLWGTAAFQCLPRDHRAGHC